MEARTLSRPFLPNLRFCFARVDTLGLRAWSDDLNVVLFGFLEDDTKLAQSPAPASARPMSNLERCIALRLVYGAGPR